VGLSKVIDAREHDAKPFVMVLHVAMAADEGDASVDRDVVAIDRDDVQDEGSRGRRAGSWRDQGCRTGLRVGRGCRSTCMYRQYLPRSIVEQM
jgi:hypothetical protein